MGQVDELWLMIDKTVRTEFLERCHKHKLIVLEHNRLLTHIYEPYSGREARIRCEGDYTQEHYIAQLDQFVEDLRNGKHGLSHNK